MGRKVTIFESYYDAAQMMEPGERARFYEAIFDYVFGGVDPGFEGGALAMAWLLVRPNLDASMKARSDGGNGGRPPKNHGKNGRENHDEKGGSNGGKKGGFNPTGNHPGKPPVETDKDMDRDKEEEGEVSFRPPGTKRNETSPRAVRGACAGEDPAPRPAPECRSCGGAMHPTATFEPGRKDRRYWRCDSCGAEGVRDG